MLSDPHHEHALAAAREATLTARAPLICYAHGAKLGRIAEMALAAAEAEFIGLTPEQTLELAEAIQEAFWEDLDLPSDLIDYAEVERGMCAGSQRYAEARAVGACHG